MKINKIILPAVAASVLLTGCDDNLMEWGTPEGHNSVTTADIPLTVKEVIANYDDIKTYAAQYTPNLIVGLGFGADMYINGGAYKELTDANFQMVTPGNAMKMDAMVTNSGELNFATVDKMIEAMPEGMKLYGHNFIWHTQQQQNYLKSLIAPAVVIESDPTGKVENIIANSDFEAGNTAGWGAWSSAGCTQTISEAGEGYKSTYAIKLHNPVAGDNYSAQAFYALPDMDYQAGDTYVLSYYVKADHVDNKFQMQLQNRNSYSAKKYLGFPIETANQWLYCEIEFEMTEDIINSAFTHLTVDFGGAAGDVWLDNVQFGKKKEGPMNYVSNGSFENGVEGWNPQNKGDGIEAVVLDDAVEGKKVLKMTASSSSASAWDLQCISPTLPVLSGKKVQLSFYVKSDQPGKGRVSFSGDLTNQWPWMNWTGSQSDWTEAFETGNNWQLINVVLQNFNTDFVEGSTTWNFNLDFGYLPGVTYYIDDVQVIEYQESQAARRAVTRASISYVLKSAEEKREALLGAMDSWIKGVADHLKEKNVVPYGYDVINEAIADGANTPRGFDNVFNGEDTAPVETEADGLNLNWESGHFYWGYYVPDYAIQAFQKARIYLPAETKLFINDYNLETSPGKRAAFIQFAKDIDAANGAPIVDGLGTQMHLTLNVADEDDLDTQIEKFMAQVDASLTELAATGKLVRITELDISIGKDVNEKQLEAQAKAYQRVFESYKRIVPEAQQSGITIWTLSDNPDEHTYWLPDQNPNLWDAQYKRKWAYKGVCDGLAGEDLGLKYGGEDYKAYYEKNNVSSTVK